MARRSVQKPRQRNPEGWTLERTGKDRHGARMDTFRSGSHEAELHYIEEDDVDGNIITVRVDGHWLESDFEDAIRYKSEASALAGASKVAKLFDERSVTRFPARGESWEPYLKWFKTQKPNQADYVILLSTNDPNGSYDNLLMAPLSEAEEVFSDTFSDLESDYEDNPGLTRQEREALNDLLVRVRYEEPSPWIDQIDDSVQTILDDPRTLHGETARTRLVQLRDSLTHAPWSAAYDPNEDQDYAERELRDAKGIVQDTINELRTGNPAGWTFPPTPKASQFKRYADFDLATACAVRKSEKVYVKASKRDCEEIIVYNRDGSIAARIDPQDYSTTLWWYEHNRFRPLADTGHPSLEDALVYVGTFRPSRNNPREIPDEDEDDEERDDFSYEYYRDPLYEQFGAEYNNPYMGDAVELAKQRQYEEQRRRWEREGRRGPPPTPPRSSARQRNPREDKLARRIGGR